jgi:hypothetical protein
MNKGVLFHFDEQCQNALDSLKKPTSIGALLAQHNDERKEVACY